MLLKLYQQWMEALNVSYEIRTISLYIPCTFDTFWHPALLSKLSVYRIQSQLHIWLTDFLHSRRQRMALNGILSSLLPVKAGVPQRQYCGPSPIPDLHQ